MVVLRLLFSWKPFYEFAYLRRKPVSSSSRKKQGPSFILEANLG